MCIFSTYFHNIIYNKFIPSLSFFTRAYCKLMSSKMSVKSVKLKWTTLVSNSRTVPGVKEVISLIHSEKNVEQGWCDVTCGVREKVMFIPGNVCLFTERVHQSSPCRRVPHPGLKGGAPPARTRFGTLWLGLAWAGRVPIQSEPELDGGTPQQGLDGSIPPPREQLDLDRLCRGQFASCGFPQEDFLMFSSTFDNSSLPPGKKIPKLIHLLYQSTEPNKFKHHGRFPFL